MLCYTCRGRGERGGGGDGGARCLNVWLDTQMKKVKVLVLE